MEILRIKTGEKRQTQLIHYVQTKVMRVIVNVNVSREKLFILGHRIANFPNYVTLTSSLTHHRIVNLGPAALRPPSAQLGLGLGVTRQLALSHLRGITHRPTADVIILTSPLNKLGLVIFYL